MVIVVSARGAADPEHQSGLSIQSRDDQSLGTSVLLNADGSCGRMSAMQIHLAVKSGVVKGRGRGNILSFTPWLVAVRSKRRVTTLNRSKQQFGRLWFARSA
jgi:hypothetical protein